MMQHPADVFRQPWLKKARVAVLGFGLGATLAMRIPEATEALARARRLLRL